MSQDSLPPSDPSRPAANGSVALKRLATEEIFLQEEYDPGARKRGIVIAAIAILFHALLFMITWPQFDVSLRSVAKERKVIKVKKYTPPPPKIEQKKIEKKITQKVPLPDPTPDEPEPIVEPEPPPEPPPIPDDAEIEIGIPEAPPQTGPLIPGVKGVTNPELIEETKVEPEYPELARKARVEGTVILNAVVRRDGTVDNIQVLKAPPADLGFSEAAIAAVRQWRYKPAMQNGRPVDVYLTITVRFALE